jgi:phosphatidate cytidylyltransferase
MIFIKYSPTLSTHGAWIGALCTLFFMLPNSELVKDASLYVWIENAHLGIALTLATYTLWGFRSVSVQTLFPWIALNTIVPVTLGLWVGQVFQLLPGIGWDGMKPLLLVGLSMVTADTGAYFAGKSLGKHKLCPDISPKKTVEGLIGGLICTLIFTGLTGPSWANLSIVQSLGLGLLLTVTAVLGDLFFSTCKRYVGMKDSSAIIPGHGGILDRFDSLFFSIPFAVLYLGLIA